MSDSRKVAPDGAPQDLYGPDGEPRFFTDLAMDRFAASFARLASEVWVLKEQLASLLDAADRKGVLTADEIKDLVADSGIEATREAELQAYLARVFGPMREP